MSVLPHLVTRRRAERDGFAIVLHSSSSSPGGHDKHRAALPRHADHCHTLCGLDLYLADSPSSLPSASAFIKVGLDRASLPAATHMTAQSPGGANATATGESPKHFGHGVRPAVQSFTIAAAVRNDPHTGLQRNT